MKRSIAAIAMLGIVVAGSALAATVSIINPQPPASSTGRVETVMNGTAIASAATVSSDALDLAYGQFYGLWYKCTSASSTPSVSIVWSESPTTDSADFVAVGTAGGSSPIVSSLTDEVAHILSLQTPPMRYGRASVTGAGGNPADTLCTLKVFTQGQGS